MLDYYLDLINNFEIYTWAIIAVFVCCFLIQLFYYLYFYAGILYWNKRKKKHQVSFQASQPGVSVIVCAKNESENLAEFLPAVLEQRYFDFEVIVINDGSTDETNSLLVELKKRYPNLRHSYVPANAQVMSSKKLALTIGIKAAKNDLLLFTDADCKPVSPDWISEMVRNFTPETELVLGYGAYERKRGLLSHLISFDTFFIALQYMGFAYRGQAYMGVGRNMAYRKQTFFRIKGFASILHLQSGDDDLFVNRTAGKNNTRIVTSPESVTVSVPKESLGSWYIQKERHLSTSPSYKEQTKFLIGTEVVTRALFYLSFVVLCALLPWQWGLTMFFLFLLRYLTQAVVINLSAGQLQERRFYLSILLFDIILPLISLFAMIENKLRKKHIYQWK